MITSERLKEVLEYDPETGEFIWKISLNCKLITGNVAGGLDEKGYIRIKIDGKKYRAHRLAWFYMTGEWPKEEIDHKDRLKHNNKWNNLREANDSQNRFNTTESSTNLLGVKGVHKHKNRYRAQIQINNKKMFLGSFGTIEEATKVYNEAAIKYQNEFAYINE